MEVDCCGGASKYFSNPIKAMITAGAEIKRGVKPARLFRTADGGNYFLPLCWCAHYFCRGAFAAEGLII